MQSDLRVAVAQIGPRLGDVAANLALHLAWVARARDAGAQLVVFPELSLAGYHLLDQVPDVALPAAAPELEALAAASRNGLDIVAGFVEESPGHRFHNAAAWFSHGRLQHLHRKVYLPNYGLFQEGRDFAAGVSFRAFDAPCGPCGLLICEDAWHPTSAWLLANQGAEILVVLSAGPARGARPGVGLTSVAVWRRLLEVTAQLQTSFVIYANRVGVEDGLSFGGGSLVVDAFGRVVGEASPLAEQLLVIDLEAEVLRRARTSYPLLRDANLELVHRETDRLRRLRFDLPPGERPRRRSKKP